MKKHVFKTETKKLLDIVIHSLYSHNEIFLRELVSNSADAINRLKFISLTDENILIKDDKFLIQIIPDNQNNIITIKDNGIGMTEKEIVKNLGTIAQSGTKRYLEKIKKSDNKELPELIGQFGVGFYSAFMVCDKIEVKSKSYKDEPAVKWSSSIDDYSFEVEEIADKERGTEVVLYLKENQKEFLEEFKIKQIIKKYSDYVEYPIEFVKDGKGEKINSQKAIWLMGKGEVTQEQYNDFYKSLTYDFNDPLSSIHFKAEGTHEFSALAFIPSKKPFSMMFEEKDKSGIDLYIKRTMVVNHSKEILPRYLNFVSGVVDSNDLPLNISREMLQNNRRVLQIKKTLTKKILKELEHIKKNKYDNFVEFFSSFNPFLKDGILSDTDNRELILDLLIFETSNTEKGKFKDFSSYVENKKEDQKEIFYIISENRDLAEKSPAIEAFIQKGYEIIFFNTGVDEIMLSHVQKYKDFDLKSVTDESYDIGDKKKVETKKKESKGFLEFFTETLKDYVKEVRFSTRLVSSPACFVKDKNAYSAQLEKLLKSMDQQQMPTTKKIFEINPEHPLIIKIEEQFNKNRSSEELKDNIKLVFNTTLLEDGELPKDISHYSKTIFNLMNK